MTTMKFYRYRGDGSVEVTLVRGASQSRRSRKSPAYIKAVMAQRGWSHKKLKPNMIKTSVVAVAHALRDMKR